MKFSMFVQTSDQYSFLIETSLTSSDRQSRKALFRISNSLKTRSISDTI